MAEPTGTFRTKLMNWLDTLEGEGGATSEERAAAYALYLRYLELVQNAYPELTQYEKESLAIRQAELEWAKQRETLPYQGMTAYEQAQLQQQASESQQQMELAQMQEATRLAGQGETGWIERWYANKANQIRGERKPREWSRLTPYERARWLQTAKWYPTSEEQALQYGQNFGRATTRGLASGAVAPPMTTGGWINPYIQALGYNRPEVLQSGYTNVRDYDLAMAEASVRMNPTEVTVTPEGSVSIRTPVTDNWQNLPSYHRNAPTQATTQAPVSNIGGMRGQTAANLVAMGLGGAYPPGTAGKPKKKTKLPKTPPAPAWLANFVPGIAPGQPIQKGMPIVTPSGEQWAATPPSVQAGLLGYANWYGGRSYEDVLSHMYAMTPSPLTGGSTRRWTIKRQV